MKDLEKLWSITGKNRETFPNDKDVYFEPIGLMLFKGLENMGYWCTPENTLTFANTGGDGVHFGFLLDGKQPLDSSPIIMTLPAAGTSNIVVGENLRDFLALGCRYGYFCLEEIEYRPEESIPELDSHAYQHDWDEEEHKLLKLIESEFNLVPWSNHQAKLNLLKEKYLGHLKYSDEYYDVTT